MSGDAGWREGARSNCPDDVCPLCGQSCCVFASDFKTFGKQSVRACLNCNSVSVNGKRKGDLTAFPSLSA